MKIQNHDYKNIGEIKDALEKGEIDLHATNDMGETPLIEAVYQGTDKNVNKVEVIGMFLKAGADVNAKDIDGKTAFWWAVLNKEPHTMQVLKDAGADLNPMDKSGETLLNRATEFNREEVAKWLLKNGEEVDAPNAHGETALMRAAKLGVGVTTVLLEHGADPQLQNRDGRSALDMARENLRDRPEVFDELWAYSRKEPLIQAVLDNDVERVKELVEAVKDPEELDAPRSQWGETALHLAVKHGRGECADILLGGGADPNVPDFKYHTPLQQAVKDNAPEMVKKLVDHGANVNYVDEYNATPLLDSVRYRHEYPGGRFSHADEIIQMLVDAGADCNIQSNLKGTIFDYIDNPEELKAFVKAGADINMKPQSPFNRPPIESIMKQENVELLKTALDLGANPTVTSPAGMTPKLFGETMCENKEMVSVLQEAIDAKREETAKAVMKMVMAKHYHKPGWKENSDKPDARAKLDACPQPLKRLVAEIAATPDKDKAWEKKIAAALGDDGKMWEMGKMVERQKERVAALGKGNEK